MPPMIEHRPVSERARPAQRRAREETREPDFIVRVRTGSSRRNWLTIGAAWKRDQGEGYSIQLSALPITNDWGGVLKLLPPYMAEDDVPPHEDGG